MTDQDWFSEDAATFGDRLAAARGGAGLTQVALAEKLGVSHDIVSEWENDISEPRANRLQMLSGMLNVSLSWLLSGQGDGPTHPEDDTDITPDVADMLVEIRGLRDEMLRCGERLGQIEKRLRRALHNG